MSTNLDSKQTTNSVKILNFFITSSIFLVFLLCPLFFTGLTAQGIGFEKIMLFYFLVLLGAVSWVTKGIAEGELKFKRTPLDWPIVATLIIFIVSAFFSVNYKDSLIGAYGNPAKSLIAVILFALFYYLVVNNINVKKIKLFFWLFVVSSTLIIIYSLLQLFGIFILPFAFTKLINFNLFGSSSSLSMFMVSILPILVVASSQIDNIYSKLKSKIAPLAIKIILSALILANLTILLILKSFTVWPIAILGVVIVLMFLLSKIIKTSQGNLFIPLLVFSALIISLVLGNFNIFSLNLPTEVSLSKSISFDIAKSSLQEDPFFGSGPSTFYYSFSKYKDIAFNNSPLWNVRFDSSNGGLFELLATVGVLGALAVVVVILISLSICFISLIKTENKEIQPILLALFSCCIICLIFVLCFTASNTFILFTFLVFVFAIASSIAVYPEKFKIVNLSLRTSPKYALALSAIFLCVSSGVVILFTMGAKMCLADIYAKQSFDAIDTIAKIELLEKATALVKYRDVYYINLANYYINLANKEVEAQGNYENYLSLAISRARQAIEISPNKASVNEAAALIYENSSFYARGSLEWAENYYDKVIKLDANNPIPYLRIALINMARAKIETDEEEKKYYISEAIKKYEIATQKKQDLAAGYYGKAIAYETLANIDEAIEQLKKAVISNRNNVDYYFELGRLYFNRGITPRLAQTASDDITINDVVPDEGVNGEDGAGDEADSEEKLSVESESVIQPSSAIVSRNEDINLAEQIFLRIVQQIPNHANAHYSLAMIYQKIGETDKMEMVVNSLSSILSDEETKKAVKQQFGL